MDAPAAKAMLDESIRRDEPEALARAGLRVGDCFLKVPLELDGERYEWEAWLAASAKGAARVVDWMLRRGVPVDWQRPGAGTTAVQYAVIYGRVEVAELLIARGADVTAYGHLRGGSLLIFVNKNRWMTAEGAGQMRKLLRSAGAPPATERGYRDRRGR